MIEVWQLIRFILALFVKYEKVMLKNRFFLLGPILPLLFIRYSWFIKHKN